MRALYPTIGVPSMSTEASQAVALLVAGAGENGPAVVWRFTHHPLLLGSAGLPSGPIQPRRSFQVQPSPGSVGVCARVARA